jgi:rhodanese-related sulfurtransferase
MFTTLDDAKASFDSKSAIFIDARPREDYDSEHITGAISLFIDDANSQYEHTLGGASKNTTIVTYCSDPECLDATKLADILVAKGHKHVVILIDGLPGWKDAGYPTEVRADQE